MRRALLLFAALGLPACFRDPAPGSVSGMDPSRWSRAYGPAGDGAEMSSRGRLVSRASGYFTVATTNSLGAGLEDGLTLTLSADGALERASTLGGAAQDYFWSADGTSDGGLVAVGGTHSFSDPDGDLWVVRRDAAGVLLWQRAFGGAEGEHGAAVRATPDGGCVVAGHSASFLGATSPWLLRLDAAGGIVWQKRYSLGEVWGMEASSDGGFVVFVNKGNADIWLFKVDADGDALWGVDLELAAGHEYLHGALPTSDGGLLLFGKHGVSPPNYDAWVVKLKADGTIAWQFAYGDGGWEEAVGAVEEPAGGYVVAASRFDGAQWDGWLLRLDAAGGIASQATYGGPNVDQFEHLRRAPDGGLLCQGVTASFGTGMTGNVPDLWILKFNAAGDCPLTPVPTSVVPYATAAALAAAPPLVDDTLVAGMNTTAVDTPASVSVDTKP